jgi:hypothetical protein
MREMNNFTSWPLRNFFSTEFYRVRGATSRHRRGARARTRTRTRRHSFSMVFLFEIRKSRRAYFICFLVYFMILFIVLFIWIYLLLFAHFSPFFLLFLFGSHRYRSPPSSIAFIESSHSLITFCLLFLLRDI